MGGKALVQVGLVLLSGAAEVGGVVVEESGSLERRGSGLVRRRSELRRKNR